MLARRVRIRITRNLSRRLIISLLVISSSLSVVVALAASNSNTNRASSAQYILAAQAVSVSGGFGASTNYNSKNINGEAVGGNQSTSESYSLHSGFWLGSLAYSVPEMDVQGNGQSIADGDTTPDIADHTYFGSTNVDNGTLTRTFTIKNKGSVELNLANDLPRVEISGTHQSDFIVTVQPSSPVSAVGGTTTFEVTFDPNGNGYRTATLSIANDDSDENPYDFVIQGRGAIAPEDKSISLLWNTFLGGSEYDNGFEIVADPDGNTYVCGISSTNWGAPLSNGGGNDDAYIAKLADDGELLWHTFLGSTSSDGCEDITLSDDGDIYVIGTSEPTGWGSPIQSFSGWFDAFIAKLDNEGTLVWNTFLGSGMPDYGYGIVVDQNNNVYVSGMSRESWGTPVRSFAGGLGDAFVAKLDSIGNLVWNTFLGTSDNYDGGWDDGQDIALGNNGDIFVVGNSGGGGWGTPMRPHAGGNSDAFVAKLDNNGNLIWNTFLGSGAGDGGRGIAVNQSGDIYAVGWSADTWGVPVINYSAEGDAFIAKLGTDGTLFWNTFLGSPKGDNGSSITIDDSRNVYITGYSYATWGNPGDFIADFYTPFTGKLSAPVAALQQNEDPYYAFVAQVTPDGDLMWSTFMGNPSSAFGIGIAVDENQNLYVAGISDGSWGKPIRPYSEAIDAFVVKLREDEPGTTDQDLDTGLGSDSDFAFDEFYKKYKRYSYEVGGLGGIYKRGRWKIIIPPRLLPDGSTLFAIPRGVSYGPSPGNGLRQRYHLIDIQIYLPDGSLFTELDPPITLCYGYTYGDLNSAGGNPNNIFIGTTAKGRHTWQFFVATYDSANSEVCAKVNHLSLFGIFVPELPSTGFNPSETTSLPEQPVEKNYQDYGNFWLEIPILDIETPIVGVPVSHTGWDVTWLWDQVGYLSGTAFPTWAGNTGITGHVYLSDGTPGPFLNLHTLAYGDEVIIHTWGLRSIYEVRVIQWVKPDDLSVLSHENYDWLTLLTCQGYEDESNNYGWRVAVRTILVKVEDDE